MKKRRGRRREHGGYEMKKAGLAALTAAFLCIPGLTAYADVETADLEDWGYWGWEDPYYSDGGTDYMYDEYYFDYDYDDRYAPVTDEGCPPATELVEYQSPVRMLRVISFNGAVVRNAPQEDGAEITRIYYGEVICLLDDSAEEWYQVRFDGQDGYINKKSGVRTEDTYKMEPGIDGRNGVVHYAMQFLGGKYSYGGRSVETGYDCSGFVQMVLSRSAGISIGSSTKEQVKQGTAIDITQIRPGDLIYYGESEETVNHTAMYIGNGNIIQAQSTGHGITIKPWNERSDCFRVVRFLPE